MRAILFLLLLGGAAAAQTPAEPEDPVKAIERTLAGAHDAKALDAAEAMLRSLLERNPESFDGIRLAGDLAYARAGAAAMAGRKDDTLALLREAEKQYRHADTVQPGNRGVRTQLARVLAATGNTAEAEKLDRDLLAKFPDWQPAYVDLYRLLAVQKRMDDAEGVLKLAVANNPTQYEYLTLLAAHYLGTGRRDDLEKVLGQMLGHAGEYRQAYLAAGDFYLRLGDPAKAVTTYRYGLAVDQGRKQVYRKRIVDGLLREGKRAEAAEVVAAILKDDPSDVDALIQTAAWRIDKGEAAGAVQDLEALAPRASENPALRYNLGRAYAARGDVERARQQFNLAIQARPDYLVARLSLAQLLLSQKQFRDALKAADAILAMDSKNEVARLLRAAALLGDNRPEEARAVIEGVLADHPESGDALYQLGVLELSTKRYVEAAAAFEKARRVNPADDRALMGAVETCLQQGQDDAAINLLLAELVKAPNRRELQVALGNTAARAGKLALAIPHFQAVAEDASLTAVVRADAYLRLGEAYRRQGETAKALASLEAARGLSPGNVMVLSTLGLVLDRAGRTAEARTVYQEALQVQPDNVLILNNLAYLLADTGGNLDVASAMVERALKLKPDLVELTDTLGWVRLKQKSAARAVEIFRDLTAKVPQNAVYRYHLGAALAEAGDQTAAVAELKQALELRPGNPERERIEALLGQLQKNSH